MAKRGRPPKNKIPDDKTPSKAGGKLSFNDVKEIVVDYGIADAIWSVVFADRIEDEKLKGMWKTARSEMKKCLRYVYKIKEEIIKTT